MPTERSLGWDECVAAMRALEGRELTVRIAQRRQTEELVAIFEVRLGTLDETAKRPSRFWPLGGPSGHPEQPGIYLREADFERAELRAGDILVIELADVVVNLRPRARS